MRTFLVALVALTLTAPHIGAQESPHEAPRETVGETPPAPRVERSVIGHNSFWIPLVPEAPLAAPLQVVLLISQDQGKTWRAYQELVLPAGRAADPERPAPMEQGFSVRELADGEYWLLSRTTEQLAAGMPGPGVPPEKIVVVDTSPPECRLELTGAGGPALVGRLTVSDPHLQPESLRVEYQDDGGQWIPLVVSTESGVGAGLTAKTSPIPGPVHTPRQVRLTVRDQAGNIGQVVQTAEPAKPPAADGPPAPGAAPAEPPPLDQWSPLPALDWEPSDQPPAGLPGTTSAPNPPPAAQDIPPWHHASNQTPVETSSEPPWDDPDLPRPPAPPAGAESSAPSAPQAPGRTAPAQTPSLPEPDRTWPVNTLQFQLEYDLEFVGPEGLMRVDLYATSDNGQTWQRRDEDPDRQSPIAVQVDREGLFGFRLHPVSRDGYAGRAPQAGDPPDVWILVDCTKPEAEITSVRLETSDSAKTSNGESTASLVIGWTAGDLWLAPDPVTLEFSAQQAGPWSTIAAGIPNRGLYRWELDDSLPRQVYLRLSVRDRAGNVTEFALPHPVSTSQSGPTARIRRVIGAPGT